MATSAISWPGISALAGNFTTIIWLKDVTDTDGTLFSLGGGTFTVKMSISAGMTTVTVNGTASSAINTDYGDGNWHNLGLAYDDSDQDMDIIVDGVQNQIISIIVPDISAGTLQWGADKTFLSQKLRVYNAHYTASTMLYYVNDWNDNGGNATALPL